ncbi:MAG: hypothetical protein COA90_10810 [Gammaproteobacteria bacterium]|nr:MAG: hypothetical protein COA90_10810 [Gammaproteobacteria bacterium]
MDNEINYTNNPLHGVGLKTVLTEIVDHYGFDILFAYLNINCFKTNPSIESSVKFLKKTDWAREKVEVFYLYEFKSLPKVSSEQFLLPPRERVIPEEQSPGEPAELNLEDAEQLRVERKVKSDEWAKDTRQAKDTTSPKQTKQPKQSSEKKADPWANWKPKP